MKPRIYIETTVPSFYHEVRVEPEMVARKQWTRQWWQDCSSRYEMVTSVAVIEELEKGGHPEKKKVLELISGVPLVSIEQEIGEIVETYVANHVMPGDLGGDALHLALASWHRCQFLLTWNCRHLANANKFEHIRHVNALLGLHVPILATPMELLGDEDEKL